MFKQISEECLKVVEGLKEDAVLNVKFSGGEPTQRDDWFEIMSRAKELGIVVAMNSNGIYSPATLDRLFQLRPSEVTISLDGFKENNDLIRGKGSFDKAIRSLKVELLSRTSR